MFEKITVKADNAHPFYHALAMASGTYPTWNFHKYLIGRDGRLISSYSPGTQPDDEKLVAQIRTELNL
jgi:glutathione peroxidase